MHILIAPNALKGSLDARAAAEAIARGLTDSPLECTTAIHPVGDGGDGTSVLLIEHLGARRIAVENRDALGRPSTSAFGLVADDGTAIIELADSVGLRQLAVSELNPLKASSFGTGEVIRQALEAGAQRIYLGLGGSATVDGGTGILRALGVRFLDKAGNTLPDHPETLTDLARIDVSGLDPRLRKCPITMLCDVDNPLLGPQGAAAIFGPQKGAKSDDVPRLDAGLAQLAKVLAAETGKDVTPLRGGGAAGGVPASLHAVLDAAFASGIDQFLDTTAFDDALAKANLVITGEGSLDEQTLLGKAPYGVAIRAKARGIPVVALGGKVPRAPSAALREVFDVLLAIGDGPASLADAQASAAANLTRTAYEIGVLLALKAPDKKTGERSVS
jgi:glycerate kinase